MMVQEEKEETQAQELPKKVSVLLKHMLKIDASDLYLTAESPAIFKVDGVGHPARTVMTASDVEELAFSLMTDEQAEAFRRDLESNFAVALPSGGRFRVNVFQQRNRVGMVLRLIRTDIKTISDLNLPDTLADIAMSKRGLVLVVGATGSGKSTTLAAMIDHRNSTSTGHIITVEDPIEFVHQHKQCVVTQREVGVDTHSFANALKNTLRQAPDVIFIGEIRDVETMESAITFAETGHLCFATLHSNNANQAIERILNFFPSSRFEEIKLQLSLNLRAIISQRLIPGIKGGRVAALEIMLDTPRIRELIKRGETDVLKDAMEQSRGEGCCTFDSFLLDLVRDKKISIADALKEADSSNNLRILIERNLGKEPNEIKKDKLCLVPIVEDAR